MTVNISQKLLGLLYFCVTEQQSRTKPDDAKLEYLIESEQLLFKILK